MRQDDGGREGPGWGGACVRDGKGGKGGALCIVPLWCALWCVLWCAMH